MRIPVRWESLTHSDPEEICLKHTVFQAAEISSTVLNRTIKLKHSQLVGVPGLLAHK